MIANHVILQERDCRPRDFATKDNSLGLRDFDKIVEQSLNHITNLRIVHLQRFFDILSGFFRL